MKQAGKYFLLALALFWPLEALGQADISEIGLPYVSAHYPPNVYGHHHQNWSVVQDDRGVVYVANNNGILEFDGASWRIIRTPTNTFVRSLAKSEEGIIYVGVQGDFGYLAPDSVGEMRFVSLYAEVAPENQRFEDVWGTHATSDGVFFQTRHRLFRWDGEEMKAWKSERGFHTSFEVRGRIYVRDMEHGLMEVDGDSLQLAPGGEHFADAGVYMMAPYKDDHVLIGTREEGFFLYDGETLESFPMQADAFLEDARLYHGCALPDGYFALATLGHGVIIIDEDGRVVQVLDQAAELPDGVVNYVYADRQGGLWMALNNEGIARAQVPSPLSVYGESAGLKGRIRSIKRHQNTLYAATGAGLYFLDRSPLSASVRQEQQRSTFEPVVNVPFISWDLLSAEQGLFVATDGGIYLVDEAGSQRLSEEIAFIFVRSEYFDNRIFVGTKKGIATLEREASNWRLRHIPGVEEDVRSMYEEEDGTFWAGTVDGDVLRIQFPDGLEAPPEVERFNKENGLPEDWAFVGGIFDRVVVASKEGIFRPQETDTGLRFVRDTTFVPTDASQQDTLLSFARSGDNLWFAYKDRIDRVHRQADGSFERFQPPALRFPKADVVRLYAEGDSVLWVGNGDKLVRYDRNVSVSYDTQFPVLIRRVATVGENENVAFGGTRAESKEAARRELSYDMNDLRFSFSMPEFSTVTENEYQYRLEGADGEWSDWKEATSVTYTNLREGNYSFSVRGRNERGEVSEAAVFSFRILPPWYRTWWAYGLYIAVFALAVLGYRHYRRVLEENRRARQQAAKLEREREANQRLQEANQQLERANKLKDTFLANTSHELRTPLTAILGFAEVIKEETKDRQHREFLSIIEENGQRLLDTLNDLLDIAKIRAGMEEVTREEIDVCASVRRVVRMLKGLAERKRLTLKVELPDDPVYAFIHPEYFERILQNLVGNAIKFTEEGSVGVSVQPLNGDIEIRVWDTGIGIDEDFLPHLFEEFRQESAGMSRTYEGSGLGLAITARLVELLNGTIDVESTKGEGTLFIVRLPRHAERSSEDPPLNGGTRAAVK